MALFYETVNRGPAFYVISPTLHYGFFYVSTSDAFYISKPVNFKISNAWLKKHWILLLYNFFFAFFPQWYKNFSYLVLCCLFFKIFVLCINVKSLLYWNNFFTLFILSLLLLLGKWFYSWASVYRVWLTSKLEIITV